MLYGQDDLVIVAVVAVPALIFWIVARVRVGREKDPRAADGRRVDVDERRLAAAQRLHRIALITVVVATGSSLALRALL